MRQFLFVIAVLFAGVPLVTHAALMFSEIAWMGSVDDANNEWIELYNHGTEDVNVDGWVIRDGASLEIPLTGVVPGRTIILLERTDDTSVPSVTAFQIYTGALPNDGRTLTLYRGDGSIEDQIAGGENWANIGGDNTTKKTPQRGTTGWVTGTPTPGAENIAHDDNAEQEENIDSEDETDEQNEEASGAGNVKISLAVPNTELVLIPDIPKVAYVNQKLEFDVVPSGLGKTLLDSLAYSWNFGDGNTGSGKSTSHTFEYPGSYVVVAEASYARHTAYVRHEVTVLPVTFSLTRTPQGDIQIQNNAKYEVDMGGFTLKGKDSFVFPDHTILLPMMTLTIPKAKLGTSASFVKLYDEQMALVAQYPSLVPEVSAAPIRRAVPVTTTKVGVPVVLPVDATKAEVSLSDTENGVASVAYEIPDIPMVLKPGTQGGSAIEAVDGSVSNNILVYLGFFGVIALGLLGIFARRST